MNHHASTDVTLFEVAGITAGIRDDYSHAWDSGWGGDENVYAILNEFFHYLQWNLEDPARAEFTEALIRVFVASAKEAVLWRRLLELAAKFPALAQQIPDAAWAEPLLLAPDTKRPMYLFIEALHPTLSPEERERIENAIMALGNLEEPRRQWGAHRRDTYLAPLRDDAIVTEKARSRIEELRSASALHTTAPIDPVAQGGAVAIDPEEFYAMCGISLKEQPISNSSTCCGRCASSAGASR